MFRVKIKNKALKTAEKMPAHIQEKLAALVQDLRDKGPVQSGWPNYSKLGDDDYHCHITSKWVACWYCKDKTLFIEVYYAGSRENAPY